MCDTASLIKKYMYICRMNFTRQLCDIYHLSDESIEQVMEETERITFGRKEVVVEEGRWDTYVYFVKQGSVRTFVIREDKYVILSFAFEGYAVSSILGIIEPKTAQCTIETLEPTTILCIPRKRLEELFMKNISWQTGVVGWPNGSRCCTKHILRTPVDG